MLSYLLVPTVSHGRGAQRTFGPVVLLLGTFASFPPLALQDFQAVVLLQLENGQVELVAEHGACKSKRQALRHRSGSPLGPARCPATSLPRTLLPAPWELSCSVPALETHCSPAGAVHKFTSFADKSSACTPRPKYRT